MEKGIKPAKCGTEKTHNYRTVLNVLLLMALMVVLNGSANAGDKIKIRLHQPPPNKLGAGDLWKLDITNSTKADQKIYLQGSCTEQKDGQIVDGKSKVFTVKPGKTTYGYQDFKDGEVNWKNKSSQEAILRTGNVKEGNYTICVTAFTESGEIADQENCIEQVVRQQGSINLISPEDGKELDPDTLPGLMFAWTPLQGGGDYDLVIVEIRGEQSEDIALKENHPFFEKKGMSTTSYQYSLTDPKFEKGKKYAWQVTSGSVVSSPQILKIAIGGGSITMTLTPTGNCSSTCCCYKITVNRTSMGGNWNSFIIDMYDGNPANHNPTPHVASPFVISTTPVSGVSSTPTNPPTSDYTKWWTNGGAVFTSPSQVVGEICLKKFGTTPYQIRVFWATNGGSTWYTSQFDVITVNPAVDCPPTNCNCPNNLLPNSGFTSGLVAGNMFAAAGGTGSISGWTCMKSTWARSTMGCCDNGYVTVYGSSAIQSFLMRSGMSFAAGTTYSIKFCAKLYDATSPNAQMRVLVGNGSGVPSTLIGTTSTISSTSWTTFTLTNWTPGLSYTKIAFSPINSSASVRSYVDIDNICITAVPNCNCPSPNGTWGNMTVTQTLPITLAPTPYNICNYGSVNNLSAGTPITFSPTYNCNPTTCAATYQWALYNNTWPWTQIASGISAAPISITLPTNGQFHATFRPLCGGTLCPTDSAWVNLTTTCFCNWGTSLTAKIGTGTPFNVPIGPWRQVPLAPHTGNVGVPITITPSFDCGAPSCTATYELEVHRGALNILVQNFTPVTSPIVFTPTVADWYRMVIRPKCGTQVCDTVDATIMINP